MEPSDDALELTNEDLEQARADLSGVELMPDEGGEPPASAEFDAVDERLMDSVHFQVRSSRRRYRPLVRTETRVYTREVRRAEYVGDVVIFDGPLTADPEHHVRTDRDRRDLPFRPRPWDHEPRRETWEDEAVVPLPLGPELNPRQERLLAVIEEPRGGFNGGRAAPMDGSEPGFSRHGRRRLPELGPEGVARTDFLIGDGWHLERTEPTGEPPGRPRIDVGLSAEEQEDLMEQVGVDRETFARLVRQGPKSPADREARAWVESSIAELMRAGRGRGIERALMQVYGCSRRTLHNLAKRGRG